MPFSINILIMRKPQILNVFKMPISKYLLSLPPTIMRERESQHHSKIYKKLQLFHRKISPFHKSRKTQNQNNFKHPIFLKKNRRKKGHSKKNPETKKSSKFKSTCNGVVLGINSLVHLNKLLADGSINGDLMAQHLHLLVGHHLHVQNPVGHWFLPVDGVSVDGRRSPLALHYRSCMRIYLLLL